MLNFCWMSAILTLDPRRQNLRPGNIHHVCRVPVLTVDLSQKFNVYSPFCGCQTHLILDTRLTSFHFSLVALFCLWEHIYSTCIRLSSQAVYPYRSLQNPKGRSFHSILLKTWSPTSWILINGNSRILNWRYCTI